MNSFKLDKNNLDFVLRSIGGMITEGGKAYRIEIKEWKERSLTANAQYYTWLPVIAKHYGEDVEYIRMWMKHAIAFPILLRDGCDYSKKVLYMLESSGYFTLNQERQMKMLDLFAVTSVMTSAQHTQMRDELHVYWAKNGLQLKYLNKR